MAFEEKSIFDNMPLPEAKGLGYKIVAGIFLVMYISFMGLLLTGAIQATRHNHFTQFTNIGYLLCFVLLVAGLIVRKSPGWVMSATVLNAVVTSRIMIIFHFSFRYFSFRSLLPLLVFLLLASLTHSMVIRSFYKCPQDNRRKDESIALVCTVVLTVLLICPYLYPYFENTFN